VTLLFDTCQPESPLPGSIVDFGTIGVINSAGGATTLRIRHRIPPGDPAMPCARFFLCDAPFNSPACMSPILSGGDIVYEVTLNGSECVPPPFATENLELDTHDATNSGAAGPVSTAQVLDSRQWFVVTVTGTASLTAPSSWIAPPNVLCGIPERSPQTESPGVTTTGRHRS
jgi:hypothetical protein